jgi:hypothetical protein
MVLAVKSTNGIAGASPAKSPAKMGALLSDMDPIAIKTVIFKIVGDSPLITHQWSEKAKKQIRDKQMGEAQANRNKEPKDPEAEFQAAMYRTDARGNLSEDGDYAAPTIMFKCAAVDAATQLAGVTKVFLRGAFHVIGEMVKIQMPNDAEPIMREDMVRVGIGGTDLRYRPEYRDWWVELPVRFNTRAMTLPQLIDLFNQAGFSTGVGEWRPQKDGSFGMFHVESVAEVQ